LKVAKDRDYEYGLQSLGMVIAFLEEALIADMTLSTASFEIYSPESL